MNRRTNLERRKNAHNRRITKLNRKEDRGAAVSKMESQFIKNIFMRVITEVMGEE